MIEIRKYLPSKCNVMGHDWMLNGARSDLTTEPSKTVWDCKRCGEVTEVSGLTHAQVERYPRDPIAASASKSEVKKVDD